MKIRYKAKTRLFSYPESRFSGLLVIFLILPALKGCLGPVRELYPLHPDERPLSIYVVSHGWHAGIALNTADIPPDAWVEGDGMPEVRYLEIGWGDKGYYQADRVTFGLILRASFLPTPSVMHVAGFNTFVPEYFGASEVVEVRVTEEGFRNMLDFITGYFQTDEYGQAMADGSGLYGRFSFFYKARGKYFLPKTSNTWTARALRSTGAPVTPVYGITSGNVMYQARRIGKVVGREWERE